MTTTYCRKTVQNEKGFTLLEMLIAVTLMAVGLLATASMQGVALNSNSIANKLTVGNLLAQQVTEDIHSRSVTDPIFTTSVSNVAYLFSASATTIAVPGAGTYSAIYSVTPNAVAIGTTRIDVTVSYQGTHASVQPVNYTTYKMIL